MSQGVQTSPPDTPHEWALRLAPSLQSLHQGIAAACRSAGREETAVKLVAVSKKQPPEAIAAALGLGQRDFGENYAQELRDKDAALGCLLPEQAQSALPRWHFIGPLQRNKVNLVAGRTALIHSVDNLSLVEALGERVRRLRAAATEAGQAELVQEILVQVNVGDEAQKAGCQPDELAAVLDGIAAQEGRLCCRGLMCIPPAAVGDDLETVRPYFARLRLLRDEQQRISRPHVVLTELSMGMSHDYAVAIAEGATLVRIGTAIFGAR